METFSDLEILEDLGRKGAIGLFRCRDEEGRLRLLRVDYATPAGARLSPLLREYEALKTIRHANLARPLFWTVSDGQLGLVYPWIEGEDLRERLEKTGPMSHHDAAAAVLEIASGLHCLHSNRLCHLDIKPENIIVARNRLVISDYGNMADADSVAPLQQLSLPYSAPEVLDPALGAAGARSDIWSCGVLLWELIHGSMDFPYSPSQANADGRYSWREAACFMRPDVRGLPDGIVRALKGCLLFAVEGRMEAAGLSSVLQQFLKGAPEKPAREDAQAGAGRRPAPPSRPPGAQSREKKLPPLHGPRDLVREFGILKEEAYARGDDASRFYELGVVAAEGLWYDEAVSAFEKAIALSKRHPPAEQRLAALKLAGRPSDRIMRCVERDCGKEWRLTLEEQTRFLRAGLKPPARCGPCRQARREQRLASPWGFVKFYKSADGFGFITRKDQPGADVYFHISHWQPPEQPRCGDAVDFVLVQDNRGQHAEKVVRKSGQ